MMRSPKQVAPRSGRHSDARWPPAEDRAPRARVLPPIDHHELPVTVSEVGSSGNPGGAGHEPCRKKHRTFGGGALATSSRSILPVEQRGFDMGESAGALVTHIPRRMGSVRGGSGARKRRLAAIVARCNVERGYSRSPLSLQLEAFIRREYRVHVLEHPHCTRAQTLHIYREALSVMSDRFVEYSALLNLIRDEYEAVIADLTNEVKELAARETDAKHIVVLHRAEINHIRESLMATVQERNTQLAAANRNAHNLQSQLQDAEEANARLTNDLAKGAAERSKLEQSVGQLSQRIIQDGLLTGQMLEERAKFIKQLKHANDTEDILREEIANLKAALRFANNDRIHPTSVSGTANASVDDRPSVNNNTVVISSSSLARSPSASDAAGVEYAEPVGALLVSKHVPSNGVHQPSSRYSDAYIHQLITSLDRLSHEQAHCTTGCQLSERACNGNSASWPSRVEFDSDDCGQLMEHKDCALNSTDNKPEGAQTRAKKRDKHRQYPHLLKATSTTVATQLNECTRPEYNIVMQWMREEGIDEREIEPTEYNIPPGHCKGEELAFLELCYPVRNCYLTLQRVLDLMNKFFDSRIDTYKNTDIRTDFKEWVRQQCIGQREADELAFSMLYFCQNNLSCSQCKSFLLILRQFLPEDFVRTWRTVVRDLKIHCTRASDFRRIKSSVDNSRKKGNAEANLYEARSREHEAQHDSMSFATATVSEDTNIALSVDAFCDCLRAVFLEKPWSNMLQLRFNIFRAAQGSSTVNVSHLLREDSDFFALLHRQFLHEAEEFTLTVVEGVRKLGDNKTNRVSIDSVVKLFDEVDPGATHEINCSRVAEYCRRVVADMNGEGTNVSVELDTLLDRFRSFKLLRRTAPLPDRQLWSDFH